VQSLQSPGGSEFRSLVRRVWGELEQAPSPNGFRNGEGGDVRRARYPLATLHHCANYAAALAVLRPNGSRLRLYESGCGTGALSWALARTMPGDWHLKSTDYAANQVASAGELFSLANLRFACADARELEPGELGDCDAVLLFELIEHLEVPDQQNLLNRLYEALPSGGMVIFSTPDRGAFSRPFSGYHAHVLEYTRPALSRFLESRSPFERSDVYQLVSSRIVAEHERSEDRGEYFMKRFYRLSRQVAGDRQAPSYVVDAGQRVVFLALSLLHPARRFDLDGYLSTMDLVLAPDGSHDRESFGLLAVLHKA